MTHPADQLTLDSFARSHATILPGLRVGRHLTIQERFEEWIASDDGRLVYSEVVRRARILRSRGWRHYSVKALVESIRYDRNIQVGPENGFKINDHYSSRMVRLVVAEYPELDGFFELRELKA